MVENRLMSWGKDNINSSAVIIQAYFVRGNKKGGEDG
jgi:hypothetical protein